MLLVEILQSLSNSQFVFFGFKLIIRCITVVPYPPGQGGGGGGVGTVCPLENFTSRGYTMFITGSASPFRILIRVRP